MFIVSKGGTAQWLSGLYMTIVDQYPGHCSAFNSLTQKVFDMQKQFKEGLTEIVAVFSRNFSFAKDGCFINKKQL